ncbi:MAG: hypothetical protein QF704_17900, partial [Anaerolineales bacterium]|nr:hypothetical protein [Anaerolineales bacterium]
QNALVLQTSNVLLVRLANTSMTQPVCQRVQLENGRLHLVHARIVLQVARLAVIQVMFAQNACLIIILTVF